MAFAVALFVLIPAWNEQVRRLHGSRQKNSSPQTGPGHRLPAGRTVHYFSGRQRHRHGSVFTARGHRGLLRRHYFGGHAVFHMAAQAVRPYLRHVPDTDQHLAVDRVAFAAQPRFCLWGLLLGRHGFAAAAQIVFCPQRFPWASPGHRLCGWRFFLAVSLYISPFRRGAAMGFAGTADYWRRSLRALLNGGKKSGRYSRFCAQIRQADHYFNQIPYGHRFRLFCLQCLCRHHLLQNP